MNHYEPIFFTPPSGPMRNRRLFKGGGGDGGAAQRKQQEDARVAEAIARINNVFGIPDDRSTPGMGYGAMSGGISRVTKGVMPLFASLTQQFEDSRAANNSAATSRMNERENLYSTIAKDATDNALFSLNKDKDVTERDARFSLAQSGLAGGSRDIDLNKDILDTYQQGVLRAGEIGSSAGNNARTADDRTRVSLINNIRAGLDEGSATQQAYEAMRNNARTAQEVAQAANLTGFFDRLNDMRKQYEYNQGVQEAVKKYGSTPRAAGSNGSIRETP